MHKLFTYGTLKKGHSNHDLLKGAKYLGRYETGLGYTKVTKGLPFLYLDPNGTGCEGELYLIPDLTLALVDRLEGHPHLYERKKITIYGLDKDIQDEAWCYIIPKERM